MVNQSGSEKGRYLSNTTRGPSLKEGNSDISANHSTPGLVPTDQSHLFQQPDILMHVLVVTLQYLAQAPDSGAGARELDTARQRPKRKKLCYTKKS